MDLNKTNLYIKDGFLQSSLITKQHAKIFYFASRFLPKDKRYAAFSVYAVCRMSDASVDNITTGTLENLTIIKNKIESVYSNKEINDRVLLCFKNTVNKYSIPKLYFDQLIEGMHMDLYKNRYENFDELYTYCYKVAGVVGLIMLKIFGYNNQQAEQYAIKLGIAMQITNILRDIQEDYQRKRIYLPNDEMNSFQVMEDHISDKILDKNFMALLKFQINRARQYYKDSTAGIKMISNLRSRFVACIMKELYAGILNSIEKNRYNIFLHRVYVNTVKKIFIAFKVILKGDYL